MCGQANIYLALDPCNPANRSLLLVALSMASEISGSVFKEHVEHIANITHSIVASCPRRGVDLVPSCLTPFAAGHAVLQAGCGLAIRVKELSMRLIPKKRENHAIGATCASPAPEALPCIDTA